MRTNIDINDSLLKEATYVSRVKTKKDLLLLLLKPRRFSCTRTAILKKSSKYDPLRINFSIRLFHKFYAVPQYFLKNYEFFIYSRRFT